MEIVQTVIGLLVVGAVAFFIWKNMKKAEATTPTPGPFVPPGPAPTPTGGTSVYDVFSPGGVQGDVTYYNAAGQQVTDIITPPSIRIIAQDGMPIDGNYGIINKL